MINKLQSLKGKSKLKFHKNISDYCNQMNYMRQSNTSHFYEDPFRKEADSIAMIVHEALLIMNFSHTKPQDKNKNIKYFDFHYTIINNLSEEGGEK